MGNKQSITHNVVQEIPLTKKSLISNGNGRELDKCLTNIVDEQCYIGICIQGTCSG